MKRYRAMIIYDFLKKILKKLRGRAPAKHSWIDKYCLGKPGAAKEEEKFMGGWTGRFPNVSCVA